MNHLFPDEPISCVQWWAVDTLNANNYNPNVVFNAELALLERSILKSGWVQPMLCNPSRIIIDGFHRYSLSRYSDALRAKYSGLVPVAVLNVTDAEAMIITIRMNRAKGSHVAFKMSHIVRTLVETHHYDPAEVALEIGATKEEITLLMQQDVFQQKNIQEWKYSKAWVPQETGK